MKPFVLSIVKWLCMKKLFPVTLFAIAIAAVSCKKHNTGPSYDTGFSINKTNVYLKDSLKCVATTTSAGLSFDWDFGDGSAHGTTAKAAHAYTAAGTYTVTLKIGSSFSSHRVKVYPGEFSYQVKNSLDRDISNWQARITDVSNTNEYFMDSKLLAKGSTTDTIFVSLIDGRAVSQLLVDGTITSDNKNALKVGTGVWYNLGQHTFFEIVPATQCNVYQTNGTIPLPSSAVSFAAAVANY